MDRLQRRKMRPAVSYSMPSVTLALLICFLLFITTSMHSKVQASEVQAHSRDEVIGSQDAGMEPSAIDLADLSHDMISTDAIDLDDHYELLSLSQIADTPSIAKDTLSNVHSSKSRAWGRGNYATYAYIYDIYCSKLSYLLHTLHTLLSLEYAIYAGRVAIRSGEATQPPTMYTARNTLGSTVPVYLKNSDLTSYSESDTSFGSAIAFSATDLFIGALRDGIS